MFEKYNEKARRALFFARYEASKLGSRVIESEHILLGILREGEETVAEIFRRFHIKSEEVRREIELVAASDLTVEASSCELWLTGDRDRGTRFAARLGQGFAVLMIAFGASFAFTVMGRITLLTKRFEFLFDEGLDSDTI